MVQPQGVEANEYRAVTAVTAVLSKAPGAGCKEPLTMCWFLQEQTISNTKNMEVVNEILPLPQTPCQTGQ